MTVPKPLRDQLGLTPGTVLEFTAADGRLVGQKQMPVDVLAKWRGRGRLPAGVSVDDYLQRVRDADGG